MINCVENIKQQKPELRVLQVFSSLGMGGAETWLIALLRYFNKNRDQLPFRLQIDICLTSGCKSIFDEEAASLGAKLFYPRYNRRNLPTFIHEFRSILANGRYHAIHDHQDYSAGLHFFFGLGYLPPVRVSHVHNPYLHIKNYSSGHLRKMTIAIGKSMLGLFATHITGTSRQVISEYGFDSSKFRKVKLGAAHCGFDVGRFAGDYNKLHVEVCKEFNWNNDSKIILFVGRLDGTQKNPGFALEVAKNCIQSDSSVRLLMVGDDVEARLRFEDLVTRWGFQDSIRFLGLRSDVPRLMIGADVLLFPSICEGLGMVAVEAQAAGLRVLASDAVPKECQVIPGMVEFTSLTLGSAAWAEEALRMVNLARPDQFMCNRAVQGSSFSIENSAARLLKIYSSAK